MTQFIIWMFAMLIQAATAWAVADLPTLPTEFVPGTTPTPGTSKSVCATVNISTASNASPIVVTVANHYWVSGQTVIVAGVSTNTAANGTWVVTKVSATQFSLNGSTGNGDGTGGTAACDYSSLQTALGAATAGWTLYLNQGEVYTAPTGTDGYNSGFVLPAKSGPTYTVVRTYDDSSGHLPSEGERIIPGKHGPYLANIQKSVTAGPPGSFRAITCKADADYYWLKTVKFSVAAGTSASTNPWDGYVLCAETGGAGWGSPPRKPVTNVTYGAGSVTITMDASKLASSDSYIDVTERIFLRCPVSCGVTGLADVPVTVTSRTSNTLTFADPGVGGVYSADASHYVELDKSMYPDHFVMDQVWATMTDASTVGSQVRYINAFWNAFGTNQALINSYIDIDGQAAGPERGKVILCTVGCQGMTIQNNYLSSNVFSTYLTDGESTVRGYTPTDWVIRRNTIDRNSRYLHNRLDASSNYNTSTMSYKNQMETKAGERFLVEGNIFTGGFGDAQSTMLHFTNISNISYNLAVCGPVTSIEGDGCSGGSTLSDLTFRNNIVKNIGDICLDIIGQNSESGASNRYTTFRTDRVLIDNNLFINCGGWPYHSLWKGRSLTQIGAISTGGGPKNVTVRHNTFIPMGWNYAGGPFTAAQWPWFKAYCSQADNPSNNVLNTDGVTRYGTVTGCPDTIGATTQHASGKLPNLTIIDNIVWVNSSSNAGMFGAASSSGGGPFGCRRDNAFDLMTDSTGVWHHNIGIGTPPGSGATRCDMNVIPGTEVLATGTQIVATVAAMNFNNANANDFRLTASSPGYRAASDGTDVGINWETLMAAVLGR